MNFQHLLYDTLVATGHVECCAIFKRRDCSVVATSMGYQVGNLTHDVTMNRLHAYQVDYNHYLNCREHLLFSHRK